MSSASIFTFACDIKQENPVKMIGVKPKAGVIHGWGMGKNVYVGRALYSEVAES